MPLSTVLGAQSLVQPAVCTTATRPASPYTGQAIYDTTTATQLIWNSTAWVATGRIAQVINFTSAVQTSSTSTSFVTSGITSAITPTLNTSKILIMVSTQVRNADPARLSQFTLFRGTVAGTNIGEATSGFNTFNAGSGQLYAGLTIVYMDSPATTSATTYTLGMKVNNAANTVFAQDGAGWGGAGATSSMILVEVLA